MKFTAWTALAAIGAFVAPLSISIAQPTSASPAAFVKAAAASDMFEIQSSKLALQKAQRAEVKDFARMMVDHHTGTSKDLAAAAMMAKAGPPPTILPPDKAQKLDALRKTPASGFDAAYMRDQVAGHQEALALHQSYAESGDNASLKQVAAKTAPIVQIHLTRAEAIAEGAAH